MNFSFPTYHHHPLPLTLRLAPRAALGGSLQLDEMWPPCTGGSARDGIEGRPRATHVVAPSGGAGVTQGRHPVPGHHKGVGQWRK